MGVGIGAFQPDSYQPGTDVRGALPPKGSQITIDFFNDLITHQFFNISILTKIEFLGWNKHTPEGFKKCLALIKPANIYPVDEEIANKAIELRRQRNIKLADAVITAGK